jgi:cation transport ATPase
MTPEQRHDAEYRFQIVLWLVMVLSIGMYFVVMRLVPPRDTSDNATLVSVLLILAIGLTAASFFLKNHFLSRAKQTGMDGLRRVALIIALTFCEAAALLGIVVWFVTGSPRAYWFLGLGIVGHLGHFPIRSDRA